MKESDFECSNCRRKFKIALTPKPGQPIQCPECQISFNDMRKSPYMQSFISYLAGKFPKSKINVTRDWTKYEIFVQENGEKAKLVCSINWKPQDLFRRTNRALATIKPGDSKMKPLLKEFIKKEGLEALII